jgi:hypothetical protein
MKRREFFQASSAALAATAACAGPKTQMTQKDMRDNDDEIRLTRSVFLRFVSYAPFRG